MPYFNFFMKQFCISTLDDKMVDPVKLTSSSEAGLIISGWPLLKRLASSWEASLTKNVDHILCSVPSEMAKRGESTESIQAVGRWKSDAYKAYVKVPLVRRAVKTEQ